MSASYPYLTLARELGLSHGVVLLAAEWMGAPPDMGLVFDRHKKVRDCVWAAWSSLTLEQKKRVMLTWQAEQARRDEIRTLAASNFR